MKPNTLLTIAAFLGAPGAVAAQNYSTAPLASPIAFTREALPKDAAGFFRWIEGGATAAPLPPRQVVLEHTYALIAASVKRSFQARGDTTLPVGDTTLARLFNISSKLGAIGSSQVVRALGRADAAPEITPSSQEFDLRLDGTLFALASENGRWRFQFPYYFMVGMMDRQTLNDGIATNLVILSTLTARDSAPFSGASQATLMIASAESTDLAMFAATWLNRMGISVEDTIPRAVPQAMRTYRTYNNTEQLWKELTAI